MFLSINYRSVYSNRIRQVKILSFQYITASLSYWRIDLFGENQTCSTRSRSTCTRDMITRSSQIYPTFLKRVFRTMSAGFGGDEHEYKLQFDLNNQAKILKGIDNVSSYSLLSLTYGTLVTSLFN